MRNIFQAILIFCWTILSGQEVYEYEDDINKNGIYLYENIDFYNQEDEIKLSGTLLLPKSNFNKVIIIVAGSGSHTRNAHYRLAEEFLNNDIAVFRFDKRGVGKSEGLKNNQVTSYIRDLYYVIKGLKKNPILLHKKLGLVGHSIGGFATIGVIKEDIKVDFLIQWATPIKKYGDFIKYQTIMLNDKDKILKAFKVKNIEQSLHLLDIIHETISENKNKDYSTICKNIFSVTKKYGFKRKQFEWYIENQDNIDIIKQDFENDYKEIKIPLFYIIGSEDMTIDSLSNIKMLNEFSNNNIEIRKFEGLNHFLTSEPGPILKMNKELYRLDSRALSEIVKWVLNR